MAKFDLTDVSVTLSMPVSRDIPPATVRSLLETQAMCMGRGVPLDIEFGLGCTIFHARSKAAHSFLKSGNTRLFMIDSDIVWTGLDFMRFLALSTKMDCICATYTARVDPPIFHVSLDDASAEIPANEYGCIPVNGVGLGFTVVTRELVKKLADQAPKITFPHSMPGEQVAKIFVFDEDDTEARTEDMAFFSDIRKLGYTVNLDPSVTLGHVGSHEFRASILDHIHKAPRDVAA